MAKLLEVALTQRLLARGQSYYWRFRSPEPPVERLVHVPERSAMVTDSIQAYSHPGTTIISEMPKVMHLE